MYLDVNMPITTGFQLLENIRANPTYNDIPIIIITTSKTPGGARTAKKLGAAEYIVKPDNYKAFINVLSACTKYHQ